MSEYKKISEATSRRLSVRRMSMCPAMFESVPLRARRLSPFVPTAQANVDVLWDMLDLSLAFYHLCHLGYTGRMLTVAANSFQNQEESPVVNGTGPTLETEQPLRNPAPLAEQDDDLIEEALADAEVSKIHTEEVPEGKETESEYPQ